MSANTASRFNWSDTREAGICMALNKAVRINWLRNYLRAMSRLGNGVLWYSILALIPVVSGLEALPVTIHVGITALVGVFVYKVCKKRLVRQRPFVTHSQIACVGTPLDPGSFPSGHTIHAASFTMMLGVLYPPVLWVLLPVALSIALSRVVLGHHYPTDVLVGALIGAYLGYISLRLMPYTLGSFYPL